MLFLAITLGFFVENQREHFIEHKREKIYAQLLYNDLKLDTSRLNFIRSVKLWKGGKLDSLKSILFQADLSQHTTLVYYYTLFTNLTQKFNTQDATMQQLKNSGNLRYFRNHELYNSIIQYYKMCDFYLDRELENEAGISYPVELIAKLFDAHILMENLTVSPDYRNAIKMPTGNPKLLTTDKQSVNEYYLFISNKKWVNDLSLLFLEYIEKNAQNLMNILKKQYKVG